jgi:predicted TIM-barrel fold metal-dependent hydrolase
MTDTQTNDDVSVGSVLGYRLWDADNHYYETPDCFIRFMPESRKAIAFGGSEGLPKRNTAPRPGALNEQLRKINRGLPDDVQMRTDMDPAFMGRDARLLLMDTQGLEAAILFPTTGVNWETHLEDGPIEDLYDNLHAFNQWILDEWGFNYQGRIFAPPLMNLTDPERAVQELEWAIDHGANAFHVRANSAGGKGLADESLDPFWARVNEAGLILVFHVAPTEYVKVVGPRWGEQHYDGLPRNGFQWTTMHGDRAIMDALANIILYNLFGRFPNIRCLVAEHGSIWVDYLLKSMDKYRSMGEPLPLRQKPSEVFKQYVHIQPYYTEDLEGIVRLLGADHVLFGSDFPHPECVPVPLDFKNRLEGRISDADLRKVMRDNLRELFGEHERSVKT